MPKVAVFNVMGERVGDMELNDAIFGAEVNVPVLHQVVRQYLAANRVGAANAKGRSEVAGSGRKPWRQKGTGRARAGTRQSPVWRGGGKAFGPSPRSYRFSVPKKMRRLAMKSALSAKVRDNNLIVLDDLAFEQPKTKAMVQTLVALQLDNAKALVVTHGNNTNAYLSARNIPGVRVTETGVINVYDLISHDKVVLTRRAVEKIEEVLA